MSVPVGQRTENTLEVLVRADELVAHTVKIMANEKVFDPKYSALADRTLDTALDVLTCLDEANEICVRDDPAAWAERRALQVHGCRALVKLRCLMRVCRTTYHMRRGKYEYWAKLARETLQLARAWRDKDAKRYGHLSGPAG